MTQSIKVQIPVWNDTIQFIFGTKEELFECLRHDGIEDYYINQVELTPRTIGHFAYIEAPDYYFIWMPNMLNSIKDYGVLVHEISHFVFCFLQDRGMHHTDDSDEAYAYLQEHVFCEIDTIINSLKDEQTSDSTEKSTTADS